MERATMGLDPLIWTHVKLFVKDVLELVQVPGYIDIYSFEEHNIRTVELCGVIVEVKQTLTMMIYILDDGTGTLQCTMWKDRIDNEGTITLGSLVRINGLVNTFRGERKLKVFDMDLIDDPNWDLVHTLQVMALRRDNYKQAYKISPKILENMDALKQEMEARAMMPSATSHINNLPHWQAFQQTLLICTREKFDTTAPFSRKDLVASDDIYDLAQQYIQQTHNRKPTKQVVEQLIVDAMTSLRKEGYIIWTDGSGDYCKVFDEYDLEQEIMDVIQRTNRATGKLGGISHQYITTIVQQKYKRQTRSMINTCLQSMMEKSLIYKTEPGMGIESGSYMVVDD